MPLPLEGVRVLDLTNVMAGPYCTMVLGDLGAEVIKLESLEGDSTRTFEPKVNDESYCFAVLNRNKKSIAVDLKSPRGKDIVLRLAARSDIVVENFRPGVVKKLGIDHESLRQVNPGLIYASMSGFGQTGPYGRKGGFDIIAQGMSGIMMMTGHPGGRPAKVGIAMNDIACGVTTLYGILGAYIGRLRHGTVWINDYHPYVPQAEWGGYKQSGIGRELGRAGLDEYRETKHIWHNVRPAPQRWFGG